nr:hypothetical transcript [Hymenolepis microstoma]
MPKLSSFFQYLFIFFLSLFSAAFATQQNNSSRHCDFLSDRTTHLVILILFGQSPFRRLSPFVHSYSHRIYSETDLGMTPTHGPMATLQPASRDFSSRKNTAGRFLTIPMDCHTRASMLQPPTVSYGNTLDRLKRAYLDPSSKSALFVGTQLSRSIVQPPKDTVQPFSQPLRPTILRTV